MYEVFAGAILLNLIFIKTESNGGMWFPIKRTRSFADIPLSKMLEPGCMDVIMAYKIPDILRDQQAGVHIADIAKRTGLEEHRLGRIMRLLATKHIFRESMDLFRFHESLLTSFNLVPKDVFVNNRLSVQLLSENPMNNLCRYK
jgi:hypothetical protein